MQELLKCYAEVPTIAQEMGYEMQTTFWGDFRVCGDNEDDITDTFNTAFKACKDNRVYGTELSLVLNWLIWYYYNKDEDTARVYDKLWKKMDAYVMEHWKGDNLQYYLRTTD